MARIDSEWEQLLKKSQPRWFSDATAFDILSRLPVKSILRFKSVCKKWYALFGDSEFIQAHLKSGSNRRYLLTKLRNRLRDFFSLRREENFEKLCDLHFEAKNHRFYSASIVASVNGIVCIRKQSYSNMRNTRPIFIEDLLLWNPATRELRILPRLSDQSLSGKCLRSCSQKQKETRCRYGFGFDSINNDYKVAGLKIIYGGFKISYEVYVYSLNTDNWRLVVENDSIQSLLWNQPMVHFNGRTHWVGRDLIDSFDFSVEKFIEMGLPEFVGRDVKKGVVPDKLCIASLGNSLICCICREEGCQTWIMQEYGDPKSWSKLHDLPPHPFYRSLEPFIFLDNGDILVQSEYFETDDDGEAIGIILLCDPKYQKWKDLNCIRYMDVSKYSESLVSLEGGGNCNHLPLVCINSSTG